jgi:hypothetical protein
VPTSHGTYSGSASYIDRFILRGHATSGAAMVVREMSALVSGTASKLKRLWLSTQFALVTDQKTWPIVGDKRLSCTTRGRRVGS